MTIFLKAFSTSAGAATARTAAHLGTMTYFYPRVL
jgi:hypothetical protein